MGPALVLVMLAAAAPASDEGAIIVTGERVPRSLRDTASSVDVTTADRIETMSGADRIDQVLQQVPNVVLGSGGDGPTIRGQDTTGVLRDLSAFLGGTRPRTTLQVDGRPVSYNEFIFGAAPLWDVERVEVFRTPQTTTQGINSIAGAIFIYSKDPTFDWEAQARLLAGNYRTRQGSIALSGPIGGNELAFRVAGDLRRGLTSSRIAKTISGADPNRDDYNLLRLKLLAEPRFWPASRIELTFAHSDSLMPGGEGIREPFRERRDPAGAPTFHTDADSLTGAAGYQLAKDLRSSTTLSFGDVHARRFSFPGIGETKSHIRDFSVESVVDWEPEGPLKMVGGVSHRRSSLDQFIDLTRTGARGIGEFDDKQLSYGVFGEASVELVARTTLTMGMRYQQDRQERAGAITTSTSETPLVFDRSFSAWLPKLSLAYDLTENVRAGVLIQRAYNPGGTTLRADTGEPENFGAETLWNYELFGRGRFGGFSVSGNLFYTAMRNAQRLRPFFVGGLGLAELFNVPRARTYGAELTVDWRASERLSARAAVGLLDTRITRADTAHESLQGGEFARSPAVTASGSIDWRPIDPLRLSAQVRHHSGYFSNDANTGALRIGPATFVDARASWSAGRVSVFGYVRNLFDAFRLRLLFDNGTANAPMLGWADDPREVGVGIASRF